MDGGCHRVLLPGIFWEFLIIPVNFGSSLRASIQINIVKIFSFKVVINLIISGGQEWSQLDQLNSQNVVIDIVSLATVSTVVAKNMNPPTTKVLCKEDDFGQD